MKRFVLLAAILVGCGSSDPVDAEGSWTVSITNGADDCNVGWNVGMSNSGIGVDITQNGADVVVDVTGIAGAYLDAFLGGTDAFSGTANGSGLTADRQGTNSKTTGNCTYTFNATLDAEINGDTMQGTISYTPATNGNSDCDAVQCENIQNFSGNRPPQ